MAQYLKDQIDWPQPFPPEEYAARRAKTRAAMAEAGIDALYVTVPADLTWLTGYDMIWYHMRSLTGLLLEAGADPNLAPPGEALLDIASRDPIRALLESHGARSAADSPVD